MVRRQMTLKETQGRLVSPYKLLGLNTIISFTCPRQKHPSQNSTYVNKYVEVKSNSDQHHFIFSAPVLFLRNIFNQHIYFRNFKNAHSVVSIAMFHINSFG